jgi:transcriptional regulator with XRE-family HTH domain
MSDDVQIGRMVREVRISRNLRQEDVAARSGGTRQMVSRLERGLLDGMTMASLRGISRALRMPSIVSLGWRSPEVDRLRDRRHAAMVEQVASMLVPLGWQIAPEHSFNHYGERGSTDILAWHAAGGALLVVETKTRLWDLQDTLVTMDRKRRLLPGLAARELGWRASAVGVVLVLPEMSTHRHVVERHAATFGAALPQRQLEVRSWLARPLGDLRGIWFLPISHQDDIGQRSRRQRASRRRHAALRQPKPPSKRPNPGVSGCSGVESGPPDP